MTEEEARKKWCPKALAVPNAMGYASGNRFDGKGDTPLDAMCKCIASDCMIWVDDTSYYSGGGLTELKKLPENEIEYCGHCGLIE